MKFWVFFRHHSCALSAESACTLISMFMWLSLSCVLFVDACCGTSWPRKRSWATTCLKCPSGMKKASVCFSIFLSNAHLLTRLGLQPGKSQYAHVWQAELQWWKHDDGCVNSGLCLQQQHFQLQSQSRPRCASFSDYSLRVTSAAPTHLPTSLT